MTHNSALAYVLMIIDADHRSGIWCGSAKAMTGEYNFKPRTARDCLERLEAGGYIKRFVRPRGHGNYPILIDKYLVTAGAHAGMRLNARATTDYRNLVYEECPADGAVDGAVNGTVDGAVSASIQEERIDNTEERSRKPRKRERLPAPAGLEPARDHAYQAFMAKYGGKPSWSPKDYKQLDALFRRMPDLAPEEFSRRWDNYMASTEPFTAKQGGSLAYFCSRFDSFIGGPIHGNTSAGFTGLSRAQQREANNRAAIDAALDELFGPDSP